MEEKEETIGGMLDGVKDTTKAVVEEKVVDKVEQKVEKDEKKEEKNNDNDYVKKFDELGKNISAQGKIIKNLEKQLKEERAAKATADVKVDLPYPSIVRSKDLSADERDDMTKNEIKMMDALADMQEKMNQDALNKAKESKNNTKVETDDVDDTEEVATKGKVDLFDTGDVKDLAGEAKSYALELAGGNREIANKIIVEFNEFAGNDSLSKEQLKARMEKAAKIVPEYKAPKEQEKVIGKAVVNNNNSTKDAFGVDAIVESASKKGGKSYSL